MTEGVRKRRRRFKQELPLKARLERAASDCRVAASELRPGDVNREALLRSARRYEAAAHLEEWLSSPGLSRAT